MEEKRLSDKEMSNQVGDIIDEVVKSGKKIARSFFDLMVERTAQSANDLLDKKVDGLKDKMKGSDGQETND